MRASRRSSRLRWVAAIIAAALAAVAYGGLGLRVDNSIRPSDVAAIDQLNVGANCTPIGNDFPRQVACVRAIQLAVQSIGQSACAAKGMSIEPPDMLQRGYGCCYERARFIEKALRHHGFQTRHVFLIEPAWGWSMTNMLPLGQASHAATEVLTSRGWMGVDSIEPFILIDADGRPYDYRMSRTSVPLRAHMKPSDFYARDLDVIHGLYSRHGYFLGPNVPGPEFALEELRWNFATSQH